MDRRLLKPTFDTGVLPKHNENTPAENIDNVTGHADCYSYAIAAALPGAEMGDQEFYEPAAAGKKTAGDQRAC